MPTRIARCTLLVNRHQTTGSLVNRPVTALPLSRGGGHSRNLLEILIDRTVDRFSLLSNPRLALGLCVLKLRRKKESFVSRVPVPEIALLRGWTLLDFSQGSV